MVVPVTDEVPDPSSFATESEAQAATRALEYMALQPGTPIQDILIDRVFIGSCTKLSNSKTCAPQPKSCVDAKSPIRCKLWSSLAPKV